MDQFKLLMNWNQEELEQWALAARQKAAPSFSRLFLQPSPFPSQRDGLFRSTFCVCLFDCVFVCKLVC
jgi:hypothetical protein